MNIDFRYIGFKFARDVAAFFVASEAFRQFTDGVGSPDPESLGVALVGAVGTAGYRLLREFGFIPEPKA